MKKISVKGGTPITLCDINVPVGIFWNRDDHIVFANNEGQRMMRVSTNGGKPELVSEKGRLSNGEWFSWPTMINDGKHLLYRNEESIAISSLESGEIKSLRIDGEFPMYIPTGHLIYADHGRLFAVRFNSGNLEIDGPPFPVIEAIRTEIMQSSAQVCFAENGTMIYIPGSAADMATFFWVYRNGRTEPISIKADLFSMFTLSPDGNKIAYGKWLSNSRIGIIDIPGKQVTEIPSDTWDMEPVWSPDGEWIAYTSKIERKSQIRRVRLGRMDKPETILESDDFVRPYSYLSDGKSVSFFRFGGSSQPDIENILLDSIGKVQTLVGNMPYASYGASFSPDQRYFVYTADESGRYEIYVQPYPITGERWQVSTEGGFDAIWSPKGDEIFYRDPDQLFSIKVNTGSGFSFKKPELIFKGQFLDAPQRSFDVSADSQRFLLLSPVNKERIARRAIIVTNWFEEVKRLSPVK